MRKLACLLLLLAAPGAWAQDEPRTGYFRVTTTPLELLGEQGAEAISSVFAPDQELTWQLSVPASYDPEKPAGAMVFIGFAHWAADARYGATRWPNAT